MSGSELQPGYDPAQNESWPYRQLGFWPSQPQPQTQPKQAILEPPGIPRPEEKEAVLAALTDETQTEKEAIIKAIKAIKANAEFAVRPTDKEILAKLASSLDDRVLDEIHRDYAKRAPDMGRYEKGPFREQAGVANFKEKYPYLYRELNPPTIVDYEDALTEIAKPHPLVPWVLRPKRFNPKTGQNQIPAVGNIIKVNLVGRPHKIRVMRADSGWPDKPIKVGLVYPNSTDPDWFDPRPYLLEQNLWSRAVKMPTKWDLGFLNTWETAGFGPEHTGQLCFWPEIDNDLYRVTPTISRDGRLSFMPFLVRAGWKNSNKRVRDYSPDPLGHLKYCLASDRDSISIY